MIVLDTSVISEPLKLRPDPGVLAWLDAQAPETLCLTTINLAELLAGVEALPAGRRRKRLADALTQQVLPLFEGRVFGFDVRAAHAFSRVQASARAAGKPISFADGAIAAIAAAQGCLIATRNVHDFMGAGVGIVDPWATAG